MTTFEELMEKFRNPGDDGIPATFADEIYQAHTDELSVRDAAISAREAAAAEMQTKLEAEKAEVLRVKAVNYDLMVAAPKAGEPENQEPATPAGETDRPRGIAALFE